MFIVEAAVKKSDFDSAVPLFASLAAWDAEQSEARGVSRDVILELFHSYAGDPTLRYQMPDTKLFLARLDRRVAGCVAIDAFNADTLEIHRLFVDPVFRGRGVARALMDRTLTHAAITQSNLVVLQTATFMAAAIDLYRSLGFAPCKPFRPSSPAVAFLDVFMSRAIVR